LAGLQGENPSQFDLEEFFLQKSGGQWWRWGHGDVGGGYGVGEIGMVWGDGNGSGGMGMRMRMVSQTRSFIRFSELESLSVDMIRWLVT
jgi:hypothetical protein